MIAIAVLFFMFIIFIASFFTPDNYSILINTVSEMAGQNLPNAWIMRLGFIGFGVVMTFGLSKGMKYKEFSPIVGVPFIIYAISIFATGIWSTEYRLSEVPYSELESVLHSIFAMIAGFSLTIAIAFNMILSKKQSRRLRDFFYVVVISGLSIIYGLIPEFQGIMQRTMFLVSFSWMIWFFIDVKKR
jgi:hypothetical membrane protein